MNMLRDAGPFEIDMWKLMPALVPSLGPDALNGSAPVQALLLHHIFPGALSRGRELSLSTLLYDDPRWAAMPAELLRDAFSTSARRAPPPACATLRGRRAWAPTASR